MGISFEKAVPDDDEAVMEFYDAEGKKVAAGHPAAVVQYLSNDPHRPKSKSAPDEDKAIRSASNKAKSAPDESK